MILDRLVRILRSAETGNSKFPPTEIFNERWMLRLLLDALQVHEVRSCPLSFTTGARWYSEALLGSPFRPRQRADALAEGFTNADAVVGQFEFEPTTKTGLRLSPGAKQFVVVEAKMFSNLAAGTKNAPAYNQAARNVACMAAAIQRSGQAIDEFESLGFFVVAPLPGHRRASVSNLETCLEPENLRAAVAQRISSYEAMNRHEATELRTWEASHFLPLVNHLSANGRLGVLSWDDSITAVKAADSGAGEDLRRFYARCLSFAPQRAAEAPGGLV